jgi:ubiquinone/menaquinone biosynthesis C-methylase UbiE
MEGNKKKLKEINWSNGYARQKPPTTIAYHTYHQYWHAHQILKRFIKRGSLVLECGCAPAQWLAYFATEFDCVIWGIDNSTTGLDLSKRNLKTQGIGMKSEEV